jgi:N6-L-threonylcarbamoyladenine synthase
MMGDELVLGIESSCDETSASLVEGGRKVASCVIASQMEEHRRFGGVVPEIASRRHVEAIVPVVEEAMFGKSFKELDGIAVTAGPGLVGALLVGLSFAKALAWSTGKPFVGVNHIEGHIFANFLNRPALEPPFLCLTVSGGHTDLTVVEAYGKYKRISKTRDDAAGEAFDKLARALGLPYPGGPNLEKLALLGDADAFKFAKIVVRDNPLDISFSGLKTAAVRLAEKATSDAQRADIAACFQKAAVDALAERAGEAIRITGLGILAVSGGVAANKALRARMASLCAMTGSELIIPEARYCTDNAAMIASAGHFRLLAGETSALDANADPSWKVI